MGCPSGKLVVALFLIMLFCRNCKAFDNGHQNCSSLCGDHKVSSPFRLKDSPEQCADQRYNLSCEQNQLVMYWESGRYRVLSINYDNYTIRVRDSNIVEFDSSSLPEYSLTEFNFSQRDPYTPWNGLNTNMIYVRCEHPVDFPGFVDTAPCFNTSNGSLASSSSSSSSSYSYAYVGNVVLEGDCRIEVMYMTSWLAPAPKNQSWSCTDIHNILLYGFELSWLNCFCPLSNTARNSIFRKILCIIQEMLEAEENDLEIPNVDVSNHSSPIRSSSDLLVRNNSETTSLSTQEDGRST